MQVARFLSGIVCMLCIAWGFSTYAENEFPYEPVIVFIGSFLAWCVTEYRADARQPAQNQLHPHDTALGNVFRSIFDEATKRYFREHSFGETFATERLDPLEEVASWNGPEKEFLNAELDNLTAEIARRCKEILDVIYQNGSAVGPEMNRYSIVPDDERISDWHSRETSLLVSRVNVMATEIVDAADEFEKHFRVLSPDSYRGA